MFETDEGDEKAVSTLEGSRRLLKRSITSRYLLAVVLIALFSISEFISLGVIVDKGESALRLMGLSSRQQVLSQRILRITELIAFDRMAEGRDDYFLDLRHALEEFMKVHADLRGGEQTSDAPYARSPAVAKIFFQMPHRLDDQVQSFKEHVNEVLLSGVREEFTAHPSLVYLRGGMVDQLLASLDALTAQFQKEGEGKIGKVLRLEAIILIMTLMVLLLEVIFIFSPMVNYIMRQFDELILAKVKVEQASRIKGVFLSNMSHELRTPLNAILGFSDALLGKIFGPFSDDRQRDYVKSIHESGGRLSDLVDEIFDLSALLSGEIDFEESTFDLADVIGEAVELTARQAASKGISVVQKREGFGLRLVADRNRIRQILVNLLSNAIAFNKDGGQVDLSARSLANGGVEVSVSDTGIGMDADAIPKAFDAFSRTESDVAAGQERAGLGLPTAKAVIEAHGGTVEIKSETNVGTTVMFVLPANRVVNSFEVAVAVPVPALAG